MKRFIQVSALCLLMMLIQMLRPAWAQDKLSSTATVVGTVVNQRTQEAIPYVQVLIKGTTLGTTTDATGSFKIAGLKSGSYILEARSIGFGSVEERFSVSAGHSRHLDLYMREQSIDLDGVVVSANRQETKRKFTPNLVTILPAQLFLQTQSANLSQGLRFQPGLRIEDNCQNCGFNQVRINGLEGAYSQILLDSRPVFSALAGVYGLEQIPASMIERVEVVRGGGSALFGANAVGGVINVITKEPLRNTATINQSLTSYSDDSGKLGRVQSTTSFNSSLVTDDRRAAVMIFGQHSSRDGQDFNGDGFSEFPELRNRSLGLRAYYKTGVYGKLTGEYRSMHEYRRGGDRLDQAPFQARIAEYLQHFVNGANLRFDQGTESGNDHISLYASAQKVLRKSYYGGGDDVESLLNRVKADPNDDSTFKSLTSYGQSKGLDAQVGATYLHRFSPHLDLTAGAEYSYGSIDDQSGYRPKAIEQVAQTYSQYDQLEYKSERWNFLLGGRLDYLRLTQNGIRALKPLFIFSPRANIRYNPLKDLSIRLSYSEGFRAPQFFDEELHVELAGGEPVARILSDGLREERSRSISASADWYGATDAWQYNILVEGFATFLKNKFTATPTGKQVIDGKEVELREIVNDRDGVAHVAGINLEGKLSYSHWAELQAGLTIQRSRYASDKVFFEEDSSTGQQLVKSRNYERTPNIYGYFTSTLRASRAWSFNLSGTYTGAMEVPHEPYSDKPQEVTASRFDQLVDGERYRGVTLGELVKTSPFFDLDVKANYTLDLTSSIKLDLSLGLQNIFNAYQRDHDMGPGRASTYIYGPMLPRRLTASAVLRI